MLRPNGICNGRISYSHRIGGGSDFGWNNHRTSSFEAKTFGREPKVKGPLSHPVFRPRSVSADVVPMEQDASGSWARQTQVSGALSMWLPPRYAMKAYIIMLLACLGGTGCVIYERPPADAVVPADSTVPADADVPLGEPPVITKPTPAFTADPRPNNLVCVEWAAPQTKPNGVTITGYEVSWSDGGTDTGSKVTDASSRVKGVRVLSPNASYDLYVSAIYDNGASYSDWSAPVVFHTDSSCIALYKMDEGQGNIIHDSIGTNDGTLVGVDSTNNYAAAWVPGISGTGLLFNGATTYVDLGNTFNFDSTQPFTIEAWVMGSTSSVGKNNTIFARLDYTDVNLIRGYWFAIAPNGTLSFDLISNHSNSNRMTINATTQLNVQPASYHISAKYDGLLLAAGAGLFVDGIEQPVSVLHDELSGTISNNVPCRIGASITAGGSIQDADWVMDGVIDDLAIYERDLTLDETANNTCTREDL